MSEKSILTEEEKGLLRLLAMSLKEAATESGKIHAENAADRKSATDMANTVDINTAKNILRSAEKHKVLSLMYPAIDVTPPFDQMRRWAGEYTEKVVSQSYRLLFLDKYILDHFSAAGISAIVLKGAATACFYPHPELRKAGDIDLLLLDLHKEEEAIKCMESMGFRLAKEQLALHHVVFSCEEGVEIELHTSLAEPFDNEKTNRYLDGLRENCKDHVVEKEFLNVTIPQLDVPYHAYELLLHMLQHFLRSGFGLKLLCDWVVFWNRDTTEAEKREYLTLVEESGLKGFSDIITGVCCRYLGLDEERVGFMKLHERLKDRGFRKREEEFMQEILEAEEFGKTSNDRMVALRGNGFWDYVREFHHQMNLNFPKAGRCFLFWPIFWMITLLRFLINNNRIRKVSATDVMKKAGQRGKLIKQMRLFEVKAK